MGKTTRFGDLVRTSGRPQTVTLWTDPRKDRSFSKAVRENRVLTIIADPKSTKKEWTNWIPSERQFDLFCVPQTPPKDQRVSGGRNQLSTRREYASNSF